MKDGVCRTGYLTLRAGAEWLGMGSSRAAARQLQRLLEGMERRDRREIMIRRGNGTGTRHFVTKAILRSYLPEHWAARDKLVGVVRERFKAIDVELQRGRVERRVLGRKLAELERRIRRTSRAVPSEQ